MKSKILSITKTVLMISSILLLCGLFLVNIIAYRQAGAMTKFNDSGRRTAAPESLSFWDKAGVIVRDVVVPRPVNTRTPGDAGLGYQDFTFTNGNGDLISSWYVGGETSNGELSADDGLSTGDELSAGSGMSPGDGQASSSSPFLFIIFHGYASSRESLIPFAVELQRIGVPSLLVDFFGSGESSGAGTTIGFREAGDVAAAFQFAKSTWPDRRIILYGVSMGGAAVLRAVAEEGLEPDGVVVESAFDRLINAAGARFRAMGLPARPLAHILLFWGGKRWGFDPFDHNPSEYARSVHCPALVICGSADRRVSVARSSSIENNLAGWKRLVVVQGLGHQPAVSYDPERWRHEIENLLHRIEPAVTAPRP